MKRSETQTGTSALTRGLFLSTGIALAIVLLLATAAHARAAVPDPTAGPERAAAGGKCDWSGATNAAWETTSNWGGACVGVLPGTLDDVRVPTAANRFPVLTSAQTFRGLEIESGAVMTIGAAGFATLSGDALISGTIRSLPASRLKLAPGFDGSAARFLGAVSIEGKFDLSGLTAATPTLMVGSDGRLTIGPSGSLVANAAPLSGNPWVVKGQIDNQGLMHVLANLSIESPSGTHTSTGHIAVEGESSLIFKGNGSQQVVLSGTMALTRSSGLNPPPAVLMEGGKLVMQGGTLTGTGALALRNGAELALASDDIFFGGDLQLDTVQVTGRALVNRNQLRLSNTSVADDIDNRGQTTLALSNTIGGKLLTAAGSTLRFAPGADGELVRLQVNGEISNSGALVLTSTSALSNWEWLISAPILTNRPGGQINVALSQARAVFGGQVINQGTFNVDGATWLTTSNVVHTNTGVIDVQSGYLNAMNGDFVNLGDLNLSGVSPVGGLASPQQTQGVLWAGSRTVTNGPGGNINAGPAPLSAKPDAPRPMSINRYWLDGELRNHGTLNVSAELTVTYPGAVHSNAGAIQINDGFLAFPESLNNSGTINFNGLAAAAGALQPLPRGHVIWIQADALTNTISGTLNIQASAIDGARIEAQLLNQGALNVNAAFSLTKPGAVHTNTGVIDVLGGYLDAMDGDFVNLGELNLSGVSPLGAIASPHQTQGALWVGSRTVTNGPGGNITAGPGALAARPDAPRPMSINRYWIDGELRNHGTLNVSAELTVTYPGAVHSNTGVIQINDGFLSTPESLSNSGVINFNGLTSTASALQPQIQGRNIWIQANVLGNTPSGTLNVQASAIDGVRIEAQLLNQGTLNVNAALTLTKPGAVHTNTGVIEINDGFLSTPESLSNSGVINFNGLVASAGALQPLPRGNANWVHSDALTNTISGTLNVQASATDGVRIEAQLLNQGTLNVSAALTLTKPGAVHTNTGLIEINDGYLSTPEQFTNAGVLNLNGLAAAAGALQPLPRGNAAWVQSNALNNAPSGTLNVLATAISATLPAGPRAGNVLIEAQLINHGTLNISASLEISAVGVIHSNSGVIVALADTTFLQPLTNAGTVTVTAARLGVAGVYTQTAGLTALNGTLSVPETWLLGGALHGAGALDGNLINGGRVAPGNSPGALSVGKHYTQLPAGSLDIELGGTTPETGYDVLNVGGDAILSGTLNVALINGFGPVNGDTFMFLSAASRSGTFSAITGVTLDGGKRLAPVYGDSSAALLMQGRVTFLPQLRN